MGTISLPLRRRRRARRWDQVDRLVLGLELAVGAAGVGGGAYLVARPATAMSLRYLQGTWFGSWRWPGVALLVLVGLGAAVAGTAEAGRWPMAAWTHLAYGTGLVAWVLLEAFWMVVAVPLQVTVGLVGAVIAVRGVVQLRLRD